MTDPAGNVLKWFSSRGQGWGIGQDVRVKATVKGHEIYKDVAQTLITRAVEIIPEPQIELEAS